MKTHSVFLAIFLLILNSSFAQVVYLESVSPITPEVSAQGGSFTAISRGYNALFSNPAGFSRERKAGDELFTVSFQGQLYSGLGDFVDLMFVKIPSGFFGGFDVNNVTQVDYLQKALISGGLGGGANFGLGYVGNNLGLGVGLTSDAYASGSTLLGTGTSIDVTIYGVIGYSQPLKFGDFTLHIGGSVRPIYKLLTQQDLLLLVDSLLVQQDFTAIQTTVQVESGLSVAFDAGLLGEWGPWSLGVSVRDIGNTNFDFKTNSMKVVIDSFGFPQGGTAVANDHRIPMSINAGVAWQVPLGPLNTNRTIEWVLHGDVQIPLKGEFNTPSILAATHFGTELRLLSFLFLRGGIQQGYITGGFGFRTFFMNLNASFWAEELGNVSGEQRKPGITIEASFKF